MIKTASILFVLAFLSLGVWATFIGNAATAERIDEEEARKEENSI